LPGPTRVRANHFPYASIVLITLAVTTSNSTTARNMAAGNEDLRPSASKFVFYQDSARKQGKTGAIFGSTAVHEVDLLAPRYFGKSRDMGNDVQEHCTRDARYFGFLEIRTRSRTSTDVFNDRSFVTWSIGKAQTGYCSEWHGLQEYSLSFFRSLRRRVAIQIIQEVNIGDPNV